MVNLTGPSVSDVEGGGNGAVMLVICLCRALWQSSSSASSQQQQQHQLTGSSSVMTCWINLLSCACARTLFTASHQHALTMQGILLWVVAVVREASYVGVFSCLSAGEPDTAEEYLRRVRYEAARCPKV